jgi:hypothetical protein
MRTWKDRVANATNSFVQLDALEPSQIRVVKRALYFGQYRIAVHFSPTVTNWTDYSNLHSDLVCALGRRDYRLVGSRTALYFNVYTNETEVLRRLRSLHASFSFSSIDIVDESCWVITHPRPKNKGPYYHKYPFRIRVSDVSAFTPEAYQRLMQGEWTCSRSFFYCKEIRDLLMFKLLHTADIREVNERS